MNICHLSKSWTNVLDMIYDFHDYRLVSVAEFLNIRALKSVEDEVKES